MGLLSLLTALSVSVSGAAAAVAARQDSSSLVQCLRSSLSPEASVYLPEDEGYSSNTIRWNRYYQPTFSVVSAVANEHDVRVSVRMTGRVYAGTNCARVVSD